MKISHYCSVFDTHWNLRLFWFLKTPHPLPLNLNYSKLKLTTPLLFGLIHKFCCLFDWKASLTEILSSLSKSLITLLFSDLSHSLVSNLLPAAPATKTLHKAGLQCPVWSMQDQYRPPEDAKSEFRPANNGGGTRRNLILVPYKLSSASKKDTKSKDRA